VVEVSLVYVGLSHLMPASWRRWILPGAAAAFALLELYATHFVALPYYAGLISHRPSGALEAFHPGSLRALGFGETLGRLAANKPAWLGAGGFVVLWVAFLAATIGAVVVLWSRDALARGAIAPLDARASDAMIQ